MDAKTCAFAFAVAVFAVFAAGNVYFDVFGKQVEVASRHGVGGAAVDGVAGNQGGIAFLAADQGSLHVVQGAVFCGQRLAFAVADVNHGGAEAAGQAGFFVKAGTVVIPGFFGGVEVDIAGRFEHGALVGDGFHAAEGDVGIAVGVLTAHVTSGDKGDGFAANFAVRLEVAAFFGVALTFAFAEDAAFFAVFGVVVFDVLPAVLQVDAVAGEEGDVAVAAVDVRPRAADFAFACVEDDVAFAFDGAAMVARGAGVQAVARRCADAAFSTAVVGEAFVRAPGAEADVGAAEDGLTAGVAVVDAACFGFDVAFGMETEVAFAFLAFAIEDDLAFAQALFAAVHGVVAGAVGGGFCRRVGDFATAFDVNAAAAAQGASGVVDVAFALHVQVARLDGAALVVHLAEGGVVAAARVEDGVVFQFAALAGDVFGADVSHAAVNVACTFFAVELQGGDLLGAAVCQADGSVDRDDGVAGQLLHLGGGERHAGGETQAPDDLGAAVEQCLVALNRVAFSRQFAAAGLQRVLAAQVFHLGIDVAHAFVQVVRVDAAWRVGRERGDFAFVHAEVHAVLRGIRRVDAGQAAFDVVKAVLQVLCQVGAHLVKAVACRRGFVGRAAAACCGLCGGRSAPGGNVGDYATDVVRVGLYQVVAVVGVAVEEFVARQLLGDTFNGDVAAAFDALQAAVARTDVAAGGAVVLAQFGLLVFVESSNGKVNVGFVIGFVQFAARVGPQVNAVCSSMSQAAPNAFPTVFYLLAVAEIAVVKDLRGGVDVSVGVMDITTVTVDHAIYGYGTLVVVDVAVVQVKPAAGKDLSRGAAGDFGTLFPDVGGNLRGVIDLRDTARFAGVFGIENVSLGVEQVAVIQLAVAAGIEAAQVFFALLPLVGDLPGAEEGVFVFHLHPVQHHPSGALYGGARIVQA